MNRSSTGTTRDDPAATRSGDATMATPLTRRDGLTAAEAERLLTQTGPNLLPPPPTTPAWRHFAAQLVHFFALLLWVAAALAVAAGMPQLGVAITLVVLLNAGFAFAQERRADKAAQRLQSLLPMQVIVRRDGWRVVIDAAGVVPGDVVLLEAGDRIPADAVVTVAADLMVDTSLLTGESAATRIDVGETAFAGTFILEGEGEVVVTATGGQTRLAEIARLTTVTPAPESPLRIELNRLVRSIALIAIGVGTAFFAVSLLIGDPLAEGFVLAVGVTVALVPEALLPTVTLALAWGAEQMADRQVLVRHLDAVESLGSTTFICTDKTGTLTQNQMTVVDAWTSRGTATSTDAGYDPAGTVTVPDPAARPSLEAMAARAVLCSNGGIALRDGHWRPTGDPMEAALDVFARRLGVDTEALRADTDLTARFPFDAQRRRMTVTTTDEILVKGAPDAVLPRCRDTGGAGTAVADFTSRGLRTLAIATRPLGAMAPTTADEAERDLELSGLVALRDPPRHDVAPALAACRDAGLRVAMITGDHPITAATIASAVGLRSPDDPVLVGADLPADDEVLAATVDRDGIVIARVSPEDKLRIARALRSRGHVVAMTGDGVNDGPALHEADIGIAMGASGSDVAREAADLVLLDDHFASIVAGIEQGRASFLNVRRFLTYHLTDNVAELTPFVIWALSGSRFPLALGVLQILVLDIGTDTLSAVALGAEPPAAGTLRRPPVAGRLLDRGVLRRAFALLGPTEAAMAMVAFLAVLAADGWRPGDSFDGFATASASGAAFMAVVLGQAANAFACRSATRRPGALGWRTNRLLLPAVAIGLAVSLATLLVGPVARQLGQHPPGVVGWLVALATPLVLLTVDAIDKHHRSRAAHGTRHPARR